MPVEFHLDLPERRPAQVDFQAPAIPHPQITGEERRHLEVLSALQQLGYAISNIDIPAPETAAAGVPVAQDPFLLASAVRDALSPLVDAQNALTAEALNGVLDRLKVLSKQVVAFATGGSGSGSASGHVIVDSGSINLGTAVNIAGTVPVSIAGSVSTTDARGLTQRMYEKSPQAGYHLWLDVTSSDATRIFIAEALDGSAESATVFQGIRVTLDASGNPIGATQTATGFAWTSRATASWTS